MDKILTAKKEAQMEKTYDEWVKAVDNAVWDIAGCSVYDLPDCCFSDWYDDDITSIQAAKRAIRKSRSIFKSEGD
jgi:hypothetical protein